VAKEQNEKFVRPTKESLKTIKEENRSSADIPLVGWSEKPVLRGPGLAYRGGQGVTKKNPSAPNDI